MNPMNQSPQDQLRAVLGCSILLTVCGLVILVSTAPRFLSYLAGASIGAGSMGIILYFNNRRWLSRVDELEDELDFEKTWSATATDMSDQFVVTQLHQDTYRWADADGFLRSPVLDSLEAVAEWWEEGHLKGRPIHRVCAFTRGRGRMLTNDERAELTRLTGRDFVPMPLAVPLRNSP